MQTVLAGRSHQVRTVNVLLKRSEGSAALSVKALSSDARAVGCSVIVLDCAWSRWCVIIVRFLCWISVGSYSR